MDGTFNWSVYNKKLLQADNVCDSSDYNFGYEWKELSADGVPIPTRLGRALVRKDNGMTLGIHKSKYVPVKHESVVDSVLETVEKLDCGKTYTTIEVFEEGRKLRGQIYFDDVSIEPQIGDVIGYTIDFRNSYDGTWKLAMAGEGKRIFCLNTMTHGMKLSENIIKHTISASVADTSEKLKMAMETFVNSEDTYKRMIESKQDETTAKELLERYLCRMPTKSGKPKTNDVQLEIVCGQLQKERAMLGDNQWATYNTATHWATHTPKGENDRKRNETVVGRLNDATTRHLKVEQLKDALAYA